jgi:hypothetical protein
MTIENLEAEFMALPRDSQAIQPSRLLKHLGQISEIEPEVTSIWSEEAQKHEVTINIRLNKFIEAVVRSW